MWILAGCVLFRGAPCFCFALNLLAHGFQPYSSNIPPGCLLYTSTRPIVDLFAAETGALLALTRYLLPDELDTAAPGITVRMEQELSLIHI